MKRTVKLIPCTLILLSVFASCTSYKVMHYGRDEITNIGPKVSAYKVYVHDEKSLYRVDKPNLSIAGVKGDLTPILNPDTITEIKEPHTRKQLKRHEHDLNISTKTEIKSNPNGMVLKKDDITDVSHIVAKARIAESVGAIAVLLFGVLVWVFIVKSFQGLL